MPWYTRLESDMSVTYDITTWQHTAFLVHGPSSMRNRCSLLTQVAMPPARLISADSFILLEPGGL